MTYVIAALSTITGFAAWFLVNIYGKQILDLIEKRRSALATAEQKAFVRPRSREEDAEIGRATRDALREAGASLRSIARTQNPVTARYVKHRGYDLEGAAGLLYGLANCVYEDVRSDAPIRRNMLDLLHVKLKAAAHLSVERVTELLQMEQQEVDRIKAAGEETDRVGAVLVTNTSGDIAAEKAPAIQKPLTQLKLRLADPELEPRDKSMYTLHVIVKNVADVSLRDCRVFVQKVEFKDERAGSWGPVPHSKNSLPLGWAHVEFTERVKFAPELLSPGEHTVEFLSARLNDRLENGDTNSPPIFVILPRQRRPDRSRQFWTRGTYRFTIVASSTDTVASDPLVVDVHWSGLPKDIAAVAVRLDEA